MAGVVTLDEEARMEYRLALEGLAFVQRMTKTGAWRYTGQGVRLGDGKTPVASWTPPGTNVRRTIYGDLTIRDSAAGEPATAPAETQ